MKPSLSALIFRIEGLINTFPVPMTLHKSCNPGPAPIKTFLVDSLMELLRKNLEVQVL